MKSLHDILQRMRGNGEQEFHDIFTNASELAADLDMLYINFFFIYLFLQTVVQ